MTKLLKYSILSCSMMRNLSSIGHQIFQTQGEKQMNTITLTPSQEQVRIIVENDGWNLRDSAPGFGEVYDAFVRWMGEDMPTPEENPQFELLELDDGIETTDTLKIMESRGLRPATFEEGLKFDGSKIEERRGERTWVVLFGTQANLLGDKIVGLLNYKDHLVSTHYYYSDWSKRFFFTRRTILFLAVRK